MSDQNSLSILFIDDEKIKMEEYVEYLELEGYNVTICQYIEELEGTIAERKYDIAIIDVMMLQKPPKNKDIYEPDKDYDMSKSGIKYGLPKLKRLNIPIIVLTNVPLNEIKIPDGTNVIKRFQKSLTLPSELCDFMKNVE